MRLRPLAPPTTEFPMFARLLMLSLLLPSAGTAGTPAMMGLSTAVMPVLASPIPMRKTAKDALGTSAYEHHELLRVKRDFGKSTRDIVLDAWVPAAGGDELTEVRLWWLEGSENETRKPFGSKTKKRVKVSYDHKTASEWDVTFGAGNRNFTFQVELDDAGEPVVYGNIKAGRKKIDHCRVDEAYLHSKKLLDVTVGLERLEVSCVDDSGKSHKGDLRRTR